ncbi:hypothetical protein BBJ28_00027227 [Nothophytophthora sp. Chile5]|nr:hypothetical protein BBJ28_00027227 [Nothophytophthora sp. Chile5]
MPASWMTKLVELWYAAQVELQGRYSPQRVRALADYTENTSLLRAMFVVGVTPIPCLVITILVDLVYLRPPSEGLQANRLFVGREYVSFWIFGFLAMHQFRHALPSLPLSNRRIIVNNVIVAALTVSVIYALGSVVGFPLPFGIIAGTPAWVSFLSTSLVVAWAKHIRANPGVWPHVMNSLKVWMCQVALVVVYPAYFYVFTTLSTTGKRYFVFLLPVIKLILRNVFSHTVVHLQDDMPEVVILNVEVFNALFVAYGMQNSPSMWTTVGLMVVDLLQLSVSLHDMSLILQDLKSVTEKLVRMNSLRDDPAGLEAKWSAATMMEQMQDMLERQGNHRKQPALLLQANRSCHTMQVMIW